MSIKPVKVGVIGCGNISHVYFDAGRRFEILDIVACADLIPERAQQKAEEFGARACTPEELLADPEIEIVVNLTIPKIHAEVALSAIAAGKNTHSEKPLAVNRKDGKRILDAASAKGLLVGCAPDTFMGGGIQTCRKLIDDGWIGRPIGASAFLMCHGHEHWHPDPEFYYKVGGGPMFDMGPYYLTALISLLGPVRNVSGSTRMAFKERLITSQPKYGAIIEVQVPTHVVGMLNFAENYPEGVVGTIITTFDVWASNLPLIEIYGTEGTLWAPDPNGFGGPVRVWRNGQVGEVPLTHGYAQENRGIGVADMAYALRTGRPHRASGALAYHVLDVMQAIHESCDKGKGLDLESTCSRPAPLPMNLPPGLLDS